MRMRSAGNTIEALSRRTGVPLRELDRMAEVGLIGSRGRSPSGARLFGEDAVRCIEIVRALQGLGLTDAEIHRLAATNRAAGRPAGPELSAMLRRVRNRTYAQIRELEDLSRRVNDFQRRHHDVLAQLAG
ncbi:MAG: MerR family transcriptional regulator [Mycobacteriaceae bacterium]|nr:MerR family transcriptional regulator [Mycobacteriaceae bacterium]